MANSSVSRRHYLPPFVDSLRIQEANRKRIVRDLIREAESCEKIARESRKMAEELTDLAALRDRKRLHRLRVMEPAQRWLVALFGVQDELYSASRDVRFLDRSNFLFECIEGESPAPYASNWRETEGTKASTPARTPATDDASMSNDPIIAAEAIVRSASGHAIDWMREPLTERERKLREAIIARILAEDLFPVSTLRGLCPGYGVKLAGDLSAALALANRQLDEQNAQYKARQNREYLEQAQRDVDAGTADEH